MDPEYYMSLALEQAALAAGEGEIPVGCVIVKDGVVIGRGRNRREGENSALAHAEIEAIAMANKALGSWRLTGCELYVTLEPCPMCAGAIINARIPRVVYGASDKKAGSCGSVCDLFSMAYNHHPEVDAGMMEEECASVLTDFFRQLRLTLPKRKKWQKPPEG